jgi:hypothetical protein
MSLPVFVNYITEEDLTKDKLIEAWTRCNLKNKSSHIDRLFRVLHRKFESTETMDREDVISLCNKYRDEVIRRSIPKVEPQLEIHDGVLVNLATSIVFEKDGEGHIAVGAWSMGKVYPLQLKHLNVCVSNGWNFKTDNENISCVFKKE